MSMSKLLLGIDLGTSGVKAGIYDTDGGLLGIGRACSYTFYSPKAGWAQSDPEKWWRDIAGAIRRACDETGLDGHDIGAVGISVFFPTVIPMDAGGKALYPAILYNDQRSLSQVRAIEEAIPRSEYEEITGNVLAPGTCAATSMAWLRDEKPEIYDKADVIGFANTYVACRLTGALYTDPITVSISGLVDIREPWQWSEGLCRRLSLEHGLLPPVAGACEVIGTVTKIAAEETGLAPGTPVVCGCGDAAASSVGAGAVSEGTVVDVCGITDCITMPLAQPTGDRRWINCAYICQGTWIGIGTATSSGLSVEWFQREFAAPRATDAIERGGDVPINRLAASSRLESSRLLYLPYLQGERTPVWDPRARGMFVGLSLATTTGDMARAVLEGTAFAFREIIDCLQTVSATPISEIRAVGGGTQNALWMQIKADVLGRPLDVLAFQETGSLGAALLAGLGSGIYSSFEEVGRVARKAVGTERLDPDSSDKARYDDLFGLYQKLYPQTREIMHALSDMALPD